MSIERIEHRLDRHSKEMSDAIRGLTDRIHELVDKMASAASVKSVHDLETTIAAMNARIAVAEVERMSAAKDMVEVKAALKPLQAISAANAVKWSLGAKLGSVAIGLTASVVGALIMWAITK